MDRHPRCGIAGGPVINHWESGPTYLAKIYRRSLGDFDLGHAPTKLEKPDSFLLGASLLCRRQAVEQSGWLKHSLLPARTGTDLQSGAEDAELCIRVRQTGWEIWYEPAAPMQHLIPARRQTRAYLTKLRGDVHRSMPAIYHVAGLVPDAAYAESQVRKAQRQYRRPSSSTGGPRAEPSVWPNAAADSRDGKPSQSA
jgi:GT2 family glycosyltransferase